MNKPPPLNDDDDPSELVAYLDGELSGEASRSLEARMNVEPGLRAEVDSLKQTWELLDYLPKAEPNPHFTERTISKLMLVSAGNKLPMSSPFPKWVLYPVIIFCWSAMLLLVFALAYRGYGALTPREPGEPDLVRDLRLIENKHAYDNVDDLELLRQLDHPDLFGEEAGGS